MASYDLCTLDDVRDYMGMKGSQPTIDTLLSDIITRVSNEFHTICGITQFKSQSYTKQYSGTGTNTLILDERPLISISSIAEDADWVFAADSTYAADTYIILDDSIILKDDVFTVGVANFKFVFVAGYETIPGELNQACVQDVYRRYKLRNSIDVSTKTYSEGGSVTKVQQGMTDDVKEVLKKYVGRGVY